MGSLPPMICGACRFECGTYEEMKEHMSIEHFGGNDLVAKELAPRPTTKNPPKQAGTTPSTEKQLEKILDDTYAMGRSDHLLKVDDYKTLRSGILKKLTEVITQKRNKAITETRLSEASWWYKNHANPNYTEVMERRYKHWNDNYRGQLEEEKE